MNNIIFLDDQQGQQTKDNLAAWEAIADFWDTAQSPAGTGGTQDDGNDMFTQCLLPVVDELAAFQPNQSVLDLGAGSGIIARRFAKKGAHVTGLDFSQAMLDKAEQRTRADSTITGSVEYLLCDLMDSASMEGFMEARRKQLDPLDPKYDIITISTTLKSLPSLEPIAAALPSMLKPSGRIIIVDLHPAFSKPAGHRGMEILEDPATGKQILKTYIKIPQYLDIKPSRSEAVRGQPQPLVGLLDGSGICPNADSTEHIFHRPLWSLFQPFFNNGLVVDAVREPAFTGEPDITQAQSYHNFQQTPMLLAFRLRLKAGG